MVRGWIRLASPEENPKLYARMAQKVGKIWREHVARDYKECVGDDLKTKMGVLFPKSAKAKANETVFSAYVLIKSRAHRNPVNAKVMKDPRIRGMCNEKSMPFDVRRMSYGGFNVEVETK